MTDASGDLSGLAAPPARFDEPEVVAAERARAARSIRIARLLLAGYVLTLAFIAFWPAPVDSGAGPLLRAITRVVPWLTYSVIEVGANVLLFVPFGILLTMVLARRRMLVLPIALAATILIETAQWLLLADRTPALSDVVANLAGAAVGLIITVLFERLAARHPARGGSA